MFCSNCGIKLQEDARFCNKCGRPTDTDMVMLAPTDYQTELGLQTPQNSPFQPSKLVSVQTNRDQMSPNGLQQGIYQGVEAEVDSLAAVQIGKRNIALGIPLSSRLPFAMGIVMLACLILRAFYVIWAYDKALYNGYAIVSGYIYGSRLYNGGGSGGGVYVLQALQSLPVLLFIVFAFSIMKKRLKPLIIPLALSCCLYAALIPVAIEWFQESSIILGGVLPRLVLNVIALIVFFVSANGKIKTKIPFIITCAVLLCYDALGLLSVQLMFRNSPHDFSDPVTALFFILPILFTILSDIAYFLLALALSKNHSKKNLMKGVVE